MNKLESMIGYAFKDSSLLKKALTTPAYAKQNEVESYERLEFLGDAVAKLIIGDELFKEKSWDPEFLTKYRSVLESNRVFSQQAIRFGLHEHVVSLSSIELTDTGILSDLFEALCGAIYIDSGRDLSAVKKAMITPILESKDSLIESSPDLYKNRFIEAVQKIYGITPEIVVDFTESGPDHDKRFGCNNLRVINPQNEKIILQFDLKTRQDNFKQKKEAEKELMRLAFEEWREKDFST